MHVDTRVYAGAGDIVLAIVIRDWVNVKNLPPHQAHALFDKVVSNSFIVLFRLPAKYKYDSSYTSLGKRGDLVEAYIGWLYFNFGFDMAARYIIKEVTRVRKYKKYRRN